MQIEPIDHEYLAAARRVRAFHFARYRTMECHEPVMRCCNPPELGVTPKPSCRGPRYEPLDNLAEKAMVGRPRLNDDERHQSRLAKQRRYRAKLRVAGGFELERKCLGHIVADGSHAECGKPTGLCSRAIRCRECGRAQKNELKKIQRKEAK